MLHTYLKWVRPQSAIGMSSSLLLLLCSCGSSSVPHEPSSTREQHEQKIVDSSRDQATHTGPDHGNVSAIHNPNSEKIEETRLQGIHVQTNHSDNLRVPNQMSDEDTAGHMGKLSNLTGPSESGTELNEPTPESDIVDIAALVALVNRCTEFIEQNAGQANNKEAVAILGETGTGKSTSINHWMGCHMELRTPEELGIQGGLEDVIVVRPDSERPEATSIGHGTVSHTFMPQVVQDPNYDTRVYLDCPGFSDNRGAEINIANAINTRRVLQQAQSVKAVFLTSYQELLAGRGSSIRAMEKMCSQLFGGIDNLRNHQNAVLLGINRAPRQTRLHSIRAYCTQMGSPAMQILANRTFLYDPLERGRADFWSRERFLAELGQMPCIPQEVASNLFQTVLTDSDKTALQRIVRHQVSELRRALEQSDYPAASRCWNLLKQLRIIENDEIAELMEGQVIPHMRTHAAERTATLNGYASQHDFTEAERLLVSLRALNEFFPDEDLVDLGNLDATLNAAREHRTTRS